MHRDELKPCPFCGVKPVAKVKKGTSRTSIPGFSGAQYFRGFVKCTGCGVTTALAKSPSAMNEAWNRRAAIVDVPAVEPEPVCTVALIGAAGHRWLAPHPLDALNTLPVGTKLYAHPPVSALVNAQADADVVERLTEALKAAAQELDLISCVPHVTETTDTYSQFERAKCFADRGSSAAWATLRSLGSAGVGSATTSKGCAE